MGANLRYRTSQIGIFSGVLSGPCRNSVLHSRGRQLFSDSVLFKSPVESDQVRERATLLAEL
jgi:hypothetical protein